MRRLALLLAVVLLTAACRTAALPTAGPDGASAPGAAAAPPAGSPDAAPPSGGSSADPGPVVAPPADQAPGTTPPSSPPPADPAPAGPPPADPAPAGPAPGTTPPSSPPPADPAPAGPPPADPAPAGPAPGTTPPSSPPPADPAPAGPAPGTTPPSSPPPADPAPSPTPPADDPPAVDRRDPFTYTGPREGLAALRLTYTVNAGAERTVRFDLPAPEPLAAPRPSVLDRLPAALVAWRWQGLGADGGWVDLARGESLVPGWAGHLEWDVEKGRHVHLFYSGARPDVPGAGELDQEYIWLVSEYLLQPSPAPEAVYLWVLPRLEWDAIPKVDHRWAGFANQDGGFIKDHGDLSTNWEVLTHEMAHLVVAPTGNWAGEGLASFVSMRSGPNDLPFYMGSAAARIQRLGGPGLDSAQGSDKYNLGYLFWLYLDTHYGAETVRQVVDRYVRTLSIDRAVADVLGRPRSDLEAELGRAVLAYVAGETETWETGVE